MSSQLGFHSLFFPEPSALVRRRSQPSSKVPAEEVVFEREQETQDSREASKKVGRLLGGSALSRRKPVRGRKGKFKKKIKAKTARKRKGRGRKRAPRRGRTRKVGRKKSAGGINIYAQLSRLLNGKKKTKRRKRK